MWIVRNKYIPLKSYKAMSVWPFIFVRKEAQMDDATLTHEKIHACQQKELLIVGFLLWYGVEYVIRLIRHRSFHKAYRSVAFEQEAYRYETDKDYPDSRRHYAWIKYLF